MVASIYKEGGILFPNVFFYSNVKVVHNSYITFSSAFIIN